MTTQEPTAYLMKIPTAEVNWDIDDKLHNIVLGMTIGSLNQYCESTYTQGTTEKYWLSHIIRDAIAQMDIKAIQTIATRLDGGIPDKKNRDKYANYIGSFIDDVLKLPVDEVRMLRYEDPVFVALAKAIVHISLQVPKDSQAARDKNIATEMIFDRCGGRVPEPTKTTEEVAYIEPKWMQQELPTAGDAESSTPPEEG